MSEGTPKTSGNRFRQHDYQSEPARTRNHAVLKLASADEPTSAENTASAKAQKAKRSYKKMWFGLAIFVFIAALVAGGVWLFEHRTPSPVPRKVQEQVDFKIFYPDPKKLPSGYTLDLSSFANPVKNGVSYVVNYGTGQKIVFSAQPKPSDNELQSFQANYLPLKTEYQTPVGQALIGAYNQKSFVSLPVNNSGTWLVITAPGNINQDQLKQVLNAIKP